MGLGSSFLGPLKYLIFWSLQNGGVCDLPPEQPRPHSKYCGRHRDCCSLIETKERLSAGIRMVFLGDPRWMEGVSLEGTADVPRGIITTPADFRPGFSIFAVPFIGGWAMTLRVPRRQGKEIDLESDCVCDCRRLGDL